MIATVQGMHDANETAREAKKACERIIKEWARADGSWVPEVVSWGLGHDEDMIIIVRTVTQRLEMIRCPLAYVSFSDADLRQAFLNRVGAAWQGTQKITHDRG